MVTKIEPETYSITTNLRNIPHSAQGVTRQMDRGESTVTLHMIHVPPQFSEEGEQGEKQRAGDYHLRHKGQTGDPDTLFSATTELHTIVAPEFPHLATAPRFTLLERYKRFELRNKPQLKSLADHELIAPYIYLFNVIVALEWQPSLETLEQIMHGLRGASDVLYDATNGYMAFGQVVFAGPELMDRADIQIMASNRFHPRSMVNGLNDKTKFSPIRIGRGVWHRNNRVVLPWDESVAYRAIAHEWAHYALGLRDEYIDNEQRVVGEGNRLLANENGPETLVVPRIRLSRESLMATLDASELVPLQRKTITNDKLREQMLGAIRQSFPDVVEQLVSVPCCGNIGNPGPRHFPASLPQFYATPRFTIDTEPHKRLLNVDCVDLEHCWLYTLDMTPDNRLNRMIAQGSIDDRAGRHYDKNYGLTIDGSGFQLFGEHSNERIALAVGIDRDTEACSVRRASFPENDITEWQSCSPPNPPVVAVLPAKATLPWPKMAVKMRITEGDQPHQGWIVEHGQKAPVLLLDQQDSIGDHKTSADTPITSLDGMVALTWGQGSDRMFWLTEYSHGGNPPTSVRSAGAPISAGSADGNLMIFSKTTEEKPQEDDYAIRIVTTRNYAGFEHHKPGEPRSYLFSVASNIRIDSQRLRPTIILYYDIDALDDRGQLVIHRYDEKLREWQPLPTYLPGGGFYAATPMNRKSAPNLVKSDVNGNKMSTTTTNDGALVEHYRLFALCRKE